MEERGDGQQNGRNRPHFHLDFFPHGNWPPADQRNVLLIAWMEFLRYQEIEELIVIVIVDEVQEPVDEVQEPVDEVQEPMAGVQEQMDVVQKPVDVVQEAVSQIDNNENHHNDNIENADNLNDNNDNDDIENPDAGNTDNNVENAEEAGVNAGVEEEEENHWPQESRSKEEDDVKDLASKQCRWWDEFSESSSDSSSNSDANITDYIHIDRKIQLNNPAGAVDEVVEEDPLPGPSRIRSRKHDEEYERSSKKSRQCYEFAHNLHNVTVRTDFNLPHNSCNIDQAKDAGAEKETEENISQQVEEEEEPHPLRSGEADQDKKRGGKKRKKHFR